MAGSSCRCSASSSASALAGSMCVDLPLVQEFVPARMRGAIGGLVTACIPLGVMLASVIAAFLTPEIGWRGLFVVGLLPALFTLVVRAWVPESPHWLLSQGRREEARRSLAWALQVPAESLPMPVQAAIATEDRAGSSCSAIHAAWRCRGWRASARRPRRTASACGRRRCSCCSLASPRPMRPICSSG